MIATTLAFAGLAALAAAAPAAPAPLPLPASSQSTSFTLVAAVRQQTIGVNVNGWVVGGYHTGAGSGFAVLYPDTSSARILYENGTAWQIAHVQGTIQADGGTPNFPWGLIRDHTDGGLYLNAGEGTSGLQLSGTRYPINLVGFPDYFIIACPSEEPLQLGALRLFAVPTNTQFSTSGCQRVGLLPQCSAGTGIDHPFANNVACYSDVANIDWSGWNGNHGGDWECDDQ